MFSEVYKLQGYSFLLGASWNYGGETQKDAKKTLAQVKSDAKTSVILDENDAPVKLKYGIFESELGDSFSIYGYPGKLSAEYLAAPLIAHVLNEGIFVQKLESGRVWLTAFSGGMVFPGYDRVVSSDEYIETLREWLSDVSGTLYGDEDGAQKTAQEVWENLISNFVSENDPIAKQAQINSGFNKKRLYKSIAAVVVLAGLGFAGYQVFFVSEPEQQIAVPFVDHSLLEQQRLERLEAELREQAEAEKRRIEPAWSPAALLASISGVLHQQTLFSEGASFTSLECGFSAPNWSCAPRWNRNPQLSLVAMQEMIGTELNRSALMETNFSGQPFAVSIQNPDQRFTEMNDPFNAEQITRWIRLGFSVEGIESTRQSSKTIVFGEPRVIQVTSEDESVSPIIIGNIYPMTIQLPLSSVLSIEELGIGSIRPSRMVLSNNGRLVLEIEKVSLIW